LAVLSFRFRVVQLNQLSWRDFEKRNDPIVAALMANMHRERKEAARVKLACLRMLAKLTTRPCAAKSDLGLYRFVPSAYNGGRTTIRGRVVNITPSRDGVEVMEIVTSWMERGLEQGRQEGLVHERKLVLHLLLKRLGNPDAAAESQIENLSADRLEQLGEALLDFNSLADLHAWLQPHC